MTPDQIGIAVLAVFVILGISHYIALTVGFNMGVKSDFNKIMSKQKKTKSKQAKYVDPFKQAMWK